MKLVPAILTDDLEKYIKRFVFFAQFFEEIHLDISKKSYTKSINTPDIYKILFLTRNYNVLKNVHFMQSNCRPYIQRIYRRQDIKFIYVNVKQLNEELLLKYNEKIVITFHIDDQIDKYHDLIRLAKHAQVMSVRIGMQGNKFEEKSIDKFLQLKKNYPQIKLHADGGINEETIKLLRKLPLHRINIGSYLSKAKSTTELEEMVLRIKKAYSE